MMTAITVAYILSCPYSIAVTCILHQVYPTPDMDKRDLGSEVKASLVNGEPD